MNKFKVSILDYLGKIEQGVLVLISIVHQEEYYEATFFYTAEQMVLTISEDLESKLGYPISHDPEYNKLMGEIIKRVIPYEEIYNRIDDVDFSKWSNFIEKEADDQSEVEYLDESQIETKKEDHNKS
jgi:hypothetical protein